jgi:hypothetical protein
MKDGRLVVLPDPTAVSPLEGFAHDVDFSRVDSRVGRIGLPLLSLAVAAVAVRLGWPAAAGVGTAIAVALAIAIVLLERDRWRAQDVMHWYATGRRHRWLEDTGGPSPEGDVAAAEVWLGTHQSGTVPQIYRVLATLQSGDVHRLHRELAAMPESTPEDRALKAWAVELQRWFATGVADTAEIRRLAAELPNSDTRSTLRGWLAQADASERWRRRDRGWLGPLEAEWSSAPRYELGSRGRFRLWISRFAGVIVFVVGAVIFSTAGIAFGAGGDQIPGSYAQTLLSTTGDARAADPGRLWATLPGLANALPNATRPMSEQLDDESIGSLLSFDGPTVIWETGAIDLAAPRDASGRRVWSIEVLLEPDPTPTGTRVILTFDSADGSKYLYVVDATVGTAMRSALGLPTAGASP